MKLDIPKKNDLEVADKAAKEKEEKENAQAKKERRRFAEKVLEGRIQNAFRYSDFCEDGQTSVELDELVLEFPDLIEEGVRRLEEAGWKTKLQYATEEIDEQSFIIIFGRKNKH